MAKQPKTIKDMEAASGKPDSIVTLTGRNVRSDKLVDNYLKDFKKALPALTLPERMPVDVVVRYADGTSTWITGDDIKAAAALLNFAGLLK
jgi:hypothetical protein